MRYPLWMAVLILTGCVTAKPVALPDGTQGFSIDCSGVEFNAGDCMNKAAQLCRGPYRILDHENSARFMNPDAQTMIVSCAK